MSYIAYKNDIIEYHLKKQTQKNINITIKSDNSIHVSAPQRTTTREVEKVLFSKIDWILRVQKEIENKNKIANEFSFDANSTICLYGKTLKLHVIPSETNYILIVKNELLFHVKEKYINNNEYKNKCLQKLLKNELQNTTNEYFETYLNLMSLSVSEVEIRAMKSRWGTCIPARKKIILNYDLIHCPKRSIEYVVLHEISHLVHPDHSKNFYNTIAEYMPDWDDRKKVLREYVVV